LDSVLIGFLSGQGQGLRSAFCDPGPLTQALRRHGFPSPIHPDKRGHCPEVPTGPRMTHRVPASGHPSLGVRSTRWGGAGSPAPPDARALAARPGCRAGEGPAVRGAIITLAFLGRARPRPLTGEGPLPWLATPWRGCRLPGVGARAGQLTCAHVGSSRSSPARLCGPRPGLRVRETPGGAVRNAEGARRGRGRGRAQEGAGGLARHLHNAAEAAS
jgi:hypothetical protein